MVGSRARQDFDENSDVDFLVRLNENFSLLDLAQLHLELEQALEKKVDVISQASVSDSLKAHLDKDKKLIYDKNTSS